MSKDDELREMVLSARKEGQVVMWLLPDQLGTISLDEFVKQPADGILYDLNRGEECALANAPDIRWVNDFAVALTIRKLVEQRDRLQQELNSRPYVESEAVTLLHAVYTSWALHGIAPELDAKIAALLARHPAPGISPETTKDDVRR